MNELVAYCGINCADCQLYIATMNNDTQLKKEISLRWGKLYNRTFDIEDMQCYGCKSGKKIFLSKKCDITPCNINKGNDTCRQCENYPCERIIKFYEWQKSNDTKVHYNNTTI